MTYCRYSKSIAIPIRKIHQSRPQKTNQYECEMSDRERSRSRTRRYRNDNPNDDLERDMRDMRLRLQPSEDQLRREAEPRRRRSRRRREHTPAPHHQDVHAGSRHHDSQYGSSTGARQAASDHMRQKELDENFGNAFRAEREVKRSVGGRSSAGRENDDSCDKQMRESVIARDFATTRRRDGTRRRKGPSDAELAELIRRSPDHDQGPREVHHRY